MKQVLQSLKLSAFPYIHSAFPGTQRVRPKSSFVRASLDPTACPQAGASADRPAEAKPALAPASPRRTARQGAVSSPRRCPTQLLLGSMWRKWLKVAAWTLAFLLSAGGHQISHRETFDNSLSLNDPPKTDRPNIDRSLKSAMEVPRHQHLATKISP